MCRMSARWNLCKCCCSGEADEQTSHFYCGCEASSLTRHARSKMYSNDSSCGDVEKRTLISGGDEAGDYDSDKNKKEEWTVENPTVNFESEFGDKLQSNRDIKIFGTVKPEGLSFTVNLCHGVGNASNIGFHFNPRFDQHYVPRNSRIHSSWGIEEAQSACKFPFVRGERFCIEIFLTHQEFLVAVNGIHFCAFSYRYPLFDLDRIEIVGGITLQKVQYISSKEYPSTLPEDFPVERHHFFSIERPTSEKCCLDLKDYDPPYVISLREKITVGTEIEIIGRVNLLPHSFYVNLQQGKHNWPHPSINLHVNVRFRETANGAGCTVLSNAWLNDGWGSELFAKKDLCFAAGESFNLKIECQGEAFHILHNGTILMVFKHRSDYRRINTLYIVGDISVSKITFQ